MSSKYEIRKDPMTGEQTLCVKGYVELFEVEKRDAATAHINSELTEDGADEVVADADSIYRVCKGCGKTYSYDQLDELAAGDRDVTKCLDCNGELSEPEDDEDRHDTDIS